MMTTRKDFIAAAVVVTAVAASHGAPAAAAQVATPTVAPSLSPIPSPSPTPTVAPPSPAAVALAEQMRGFDPQLTDAQVTSITKGIQQNLDFGKTLNPHGTKLKNGAAPSPQFRVNP